MSQKVGFAVSATMVGREPTAMFPPVGSHVKMEESASNSTNMGTTAVTAKMVGQDTTAVFPHAESLVNMEESASSMNMTTMPVIAQPDGVDEPAVMMSRNVTQDTLLLTITTNTLSATTMEIVKIYQGATSASVT